MTDSISNAFFNGDDMNSWLSLTNQKLYFARLLLQQNHNEDNQARTQAMEQGGLHLLHDAWVSYLNELAFNVAAKQRFTTFEQLDAALPLLTGEMVEIKSLLSQSDSWLSAMLSKVSQMQLQAQEPPTQMASSPLIASSSNGAFTSLDYWRLLSELIDSQRENRQES